MSNSDFQTSASFASPRKQSATMPESPWKKPNRISLSKTKSLKRKSEIFNIYNQSGNGSSLNLNDSARNDSSFKCDTIENNFLEEAASNSASDCFYSNQPASKTRKTVFNKFSLNNNSMNLSTFSNSPIQSKSSYEKFNDSLNGGMQEQNKDDLYTFFNRNSKIEEANESITKDEDQLSAKNKKLGEKILSFGSSNALLANIYSNLSKNVSDEKNLKEAKEEYLLVSENLLPADWSLKTRIRFLSTKQFMCYTGIRSQHESEALLNFSKYNHFYKCLFADKCKSFEDNKDLIKTLFCEASSYWTFPYLPWFNLYPRNSNLSSMSSEPLNIEWQKSLSKSWNQSFKSLYNSLKSNQCPYFYLLTQNFAVLFRAQNMCGMEEMHAILTPSTKGLRHTLKDINFTMPFMNNTQQRKSDNFENEINELSNSANENSTDQVNLVDTSISANNNSVEPSSTEEQDEKSKKVSSDDEDNGDEGESEDEPDEWLEQIGLNSTVNFKASVLQRNSKNKANDSLYNFDNRPKSTLLFSQGCDVQALFNFLLNSKTCIASSGPLTGIPPTLLSPLAFINGSLQRLKVEQHVVKSLNKAGEPITQYALDFVGPLMPFHVHRLCNLFRLTQSGEFNMTANVYEQTTSFNCIKKQEKSSKFYLGDDTSNQDIATKNASNEEYLSKYLDVSEMKSIDASYGVYGEAKAVKTIVCKNDAFYCN